MVSVNDAQVSVIICPALLRTVSDAMLVACTLNISKKLTRPLPQGSL